MSATSNKRILTLDGGGVRGVAILACLEQLESRTQKPICELFDLIVGVSTGALIAVALGLRRMRVAQVRQLYYHMATDLFSSGAANPLTSGSGCYYESAPLQALLEEHFGGDGAMMTEYPPQCGLRPHVIIVANDVSMLPPTPVLFSNYKQSSGGVPLVKAVLASCAAPLYFPPVRLGASDPRVLVDGAVGHNNPLLIAIAQFDAIYGREQLRMVLSIGTGRQQRTANPSLVAGGSLQALSRSMAPGYLQSLVSTMSNVAPALGLVKMLALLATDTEQSAMAGQLLFPQNREEAGTTEGVTYVRVNPEVGERCGLDEFDHAVLRRLEQSMLEHVASDVEFTKFLSLLV